MSLRKKLLPLILTGGIVLVDQVVKFVVSKTLPYGRPVQIIGDFLRFTFVQNPALSFSIGRGLGDTGRIILTMVLPMLVVAVVLYYFLAAKDLTQGQRWIMAAIMGGGLGNQVDRYFRPAGVIDFIDIKFYGILRLERWPVFNVADSTVVVAAIALLISYLVTGVREKNEQKS
ncbi:MAG: signal peptidase II [Spirochaetaceae bacterium]|nr:MAG: signal peptidase II [Spirochaetaceae bacterium]